MAAPPPPCRSWQDLQDDALGIIAGFLPCPADRICMSSVCRDWHRAVLIPPLPRPPQLPFLLLPSSTGNVIPRPCLFCVLGNDAHRANLPKCAREACCFGAYDGGWLFVADGQTHELVNLHTHQRSRLPNNFLQPASGESPDVVLSMTILAATLSSSPPTQGDLAQECFGAAIFIVTTSVEILQTPSPPDIMLWRVRDNGEDYPDPIPLCQNHLVVDVIFYNGAFHFLTHREHLVVITPPPPDGYLVEGIEVFRFRNEFYFGHVGERIDASYLVESRGKLLMVVRYNRCLGGPASSFMVYQMTRLEAPTHDYDDREYEWKAAALDGRMLFVGRGCSRSYEVADFPGSDEGVYFFDDRSFDTLKMMHADAHRRYTCRDNGSWSQTPPPSFRRWLPDEPVSRYSSPVWFLP